MAKVECMLNMVEQVEECGSALIEYDRRRKDFLIGGAQLETTHRVMAIYTTIYENLGAPPPFYTYEYGIVMVW